MLRRLAALGGRQFLRLRPVKTPEDVSDFGYEQTELEDYLGYYDRYGDYTDEGFSNFLQLYYLEIFLLFFSFFFILKNQLTRAKKSSFLEKQNHQ